MTWSLFAVIVGSAPCARAQQQPQRSTWECLPEETAFAVRVPNGSAVFEALVENTKLGAVVFSNERREKLRELMATWQEDDSEDNPLAELAKSGITPDDLPRFFAGESGFAMLIDAPGEETPRAFGVGWLEAGEELARNAVECVARTVENHQDDEHPPRRIDLEVSSQSVMQITVPSLHVEYGELKLPDDLDNLSEEDQERAWDEAFEKYEKSGKTTVKFKTFLLTVLGDRVLFAYTAEDSPADEREEAGARLESVFARLLEAHAGDGGDFVSRIKTARGVGRVYDAQGAVVVEALGDVASLLKLARANEDFRSDPNSEKVMRMLGIDQLGPFAARMTLDGTLLQSGAFLSAPEPRRGVLRLLDQAPLPAEPPAWIPATAVSYNHLSFDFSQAYRIIKEEVVKEFGDEARQAFDLADLQARNLAGVPVEKLLGALGRRQVSISYEPDVVQQPVGDGAELAVPQDRIAVVWEVQDEDVMQALLNNAARFAPLVPGAEETEEQGFRGWRMENVGIEGGLVAGKGHVVMAIGRGVLETTLSSLNNPPAGRNALRESELYDRASRLFDLRPAIGFELTDANLSVQAARRILQSLASDWETLTADFADEDLEASEMVWFNVMRNLLPDESELENIFGVAVSDFQVDEQGISTRSVIELPSD